MIHDTPAMHGALKHWTPIDAANAALDAISRAALIASVLAIARARPDVGVAASVLATGAILVRGALVGRSLRQHLLDAFRDATLAVRARPVAVAADGERDVDDTVQLIDAVRLRAEHRATLRPRTVAVAVQIALIAVAAVVLLGVQALVLGALGAAALGAVAYALGARLRRVRREQWRTFRGLLRDLRVLVDGALELRAQGREVAQAGRIDASAKQFARAELEVARGQAFVVWLPAALGAVALAGSGRAAAARVLGVLHVERFAEGGILGAALFVAGLELLRMQEVRARWQVASRALPEAPSQPGGAEAPRGATVDLATAPIELDGFTHRYPGASRATPPPISVSWPVGKGLAVVGPNGSGKTTLVLTLLGFLPSTRGQLRVAGVDLADLDPESIRAATAFAPQQPFTALAESIAWHAEVFGDDVGAACGPGLADVGLLERLEARAASRGVAVGDLRLGELSGGERQRVHIARVLSSCRALLVLDEPEAALDDASRAALRDTLERRAVASRVLLIAHDLAVVPPSFVVLRLGEERNGL